MLDCMIIGDSIAVGTHIIYSECALYGKGGINTWQWNKMWPSISESADKAIISLGTNDHAGVNTQKELESVREKIKARKVFWILPFGNLEASKVPISKIQSIVRDIAAKNNDTVVEMVSMQPDKIHPDYRGYADIVKNVKEN